MLKGHIWRLDTLAAFSAFAASSCAPLQTDASGPSAVAFRPTASESIASPADIYGSLFEQVQMRRIFADGKSFVDAVPRRPADEIMRQYHATPPRDDAALRAFVDRYFVMPVEGPGDTELSTSAAKPLIDHIQSLWDQLARPPVVPVAGSSALAFGGHHVVPGGRFREIYYWDSYFTMLGLKVDQRDDLIEGMINGFVGLVEDHGHVPNGARSYYLSRSQPPFLYLMMGLSAEDDVQVQSHRLDALLTEHGYWMEGGRVQTLPDGSTLNRYWDERSTPRDESYREDVETARSSSRPAAEVYRHLRAGAESGWDFSSRWFADGRTLSTVDTTAIIPVDLNSLLYGLERAIAKRCKGAGRDCAQRFNQAADRRRAAIERWLWSESEGRYGDFDTRTGRIRDGLTAATAYPLFARLASPDRASRVAETVRARLIAPGGLRTSLVETGEQWDRPNGWAPLQWIAADGLAGYGHDDIARRIANAWVTTVERGYRISGKLVEKYDVEQLRSGGGGEYPLQDGFGWTNGVTRAMIARWPLP